MAEPILSRHRLPHPYRVLLAALWCAPMFLLLLAVLIGRGLSPSLLDPRFWLPLCVPLLPALYVWREGVDVLPGGIRSNLHGSRYYPYETLDNWYLDNRPERRILTVWACDGRKVLQVHAAHLTDLPRLLAALKEHLRYRNWPY
jgi:hypothetical protein